MEQSHPERKTYELRYRTDLQLPDIGVNSPYQVIRGHLQVLESGSERPAACDPEREASCVLSALKEFRIPLADYGLTREALDNLVRKNFLQKARGIVADVPAMKEYPGVYYPLKELVDTLVWCGNGTYADIGATEESIVTLDKEVNTVIAARLVKTLRSLASATDYSTKEEQQNRIDRSKLHVSQLAERIGIRLEDLGMTTEEFNGLAPAEKPQSSLGRLLGRFGLR